GKNGLEKSFESYLRGTDGTAQVEIDASKKIIRYLPDETPPISGNNVYLTIDRDLQIASYDILEDMLKQALIAKLKGGETMVPITDKSFFASMIKSNTFDITKIMESTEDNPAYILQNYVLWHNPEAVWTDTESKYDIKLLMSQAILDGKISPAQMLMIMIDQNLITGGQELRDSLENRRVSAHNVIIEKLESGEITPQMTNLDPSTGSVVVTDVKNGNILAAVGYPSYDSNQYIVNTDPNFFTDMNEDLTRPLTNRPFMETRAPGSTLKMITAMATLESGAITPTTLIYDAHTFTTVGHPYVSCWSAVSHGRINISQALATSCNYFFCESVYRVGEPGNNGKFERIATLNEYMKMFGLDSPTGVEIGEDDTQMPTPDVKDRMLLNANPETPVYEREWYDGDTMQVSIGQGFSNYTAANMNKYILTLATHGIRYELHLVDSVKAANGTVIKNTRPVIEAQDLPISDGTWDAIYRGMLDVTEASYGTGRNTFAEFPISVAGKTGTAQQVTNRNSHSSFGGFAPFEDPEIAIYVVIPFGDTKSMSALASKVAIEVMEVYFGLDKSPQYAEPVNVLVE
ncbi:MAG: hypothetical protein LBQ68_08500, partial [Clostridiales bacterium]|nr:hypothetical protein [Clostridiales bacterium]